MGTAREREQVTMERKAPGIKVRFLYCMGAENIDG